MRRYLEIFLNPRMLVITLMGFSSGVPLALTAGTLQAWMTDAGVDLSTIAVFSLVGLPYTLKFLWAPLLDRYSMPFGRRRGWLLLIQLCLLLSIVALGSVQPAEQRLLTACLAFLVSFFSATQDIVVDAYRTELLSAAERGSGSAATNVGYRIGMLTSGSIALVMADHLAWPAVYWIMAGTMVVGMLATLSAEEPHAPIKPQSLLQLVVEPLRQYFKRPAAAEILAFIVLYKVDIVMAASLLTPFMMHLGFSKTEIGAITKTVGIVAAIIGSMVGGGLYGKLGMRKALMAFGIIQGASTLSFALLARAGNDQLLMAACVAFENFCAGLATVPFIALLMTLCDKRFAATHYALLSSFAAISRVFSAPTGALVERVGWTSFFVICALTALPALALLWFRYERWQIEPEQ